MDIQNHWHNESGLPQHGWEVVDKIHLNELVGVADRLALYGMTFTPAEKILTVKHEDGSIEERKMLEYRTRCGMCNGLRVIHLWILQHPDIEYFLGVGYGCAARLCHDLTPARHHILRDGPEPLTHFIEVENPYVITPDMLAAERERQQAEWAERERQQVERERVEAERTERQQAERRAERERQQAAWIRQQVEREAVRREEIRQGWKNRVGEEMFGLSADGFAIDFVDSQLRPVKLCFDTPTTDCIQKYESRFPNMVWLVDSGPTRRVTNKGNYLTASVDEVYCTCTRPIYLDYGPWILQVRKLHEGGNCWGYERKPEAIL